jgi:RNA 2',3'-cyclic 3'-phosphodiesterase
MVMRVFVAMDIPEAVRDSLRDFLRRLPNTPGAKWVRPKSMHLTLKFIGEVKPEAIEVIESVLRNVPFASTVAIRFRGTGFFPRESRPSVLWAGVKASDSLAELAASIDRSCAAAGIPGETRAYSPHLTLARFKTPEGLDLLRKEITRIGPMDFGSAQVAEFHLFHSVLKKTGAEYTRLATFPALHRGQDKK